MPSGRRPSPFRLLRAVMRLADLARADGSLRRDGGDCWNLKQLAEHMGMAKAPALDALAWLTAEGRLAVTKGKPSAYGRGVDERRLIVPTIHESSSGLNKPTVHLTSSDVSQSSHDNPRFTNPVATVQKTVGHGSTVDLSREPHPGIPGTPGNTRPINSQSFSAGRADETQPGRESVDRPTTAVSTSSSSFSAERINTDASVNPLQPECPRCHSRLTLNVLATGERRGRCMRCQFRFELPT